MIPDFETYNNLYKDLVEIAARFDGDKNVTNNKESKDVVAYKNTYVFFYC